MTNGKEFMSIVPGFDTEPKFEPDYAVFPTSVAESSPSDPWMGELQSLLKELENITAAEQSLPPVFGSELDNQLVQVRLGMASSLFAALQCKHAATAGHSLRVALTCSAWSLHMRLPPEQRDAIEVAALLHDIGIIGAPDSILLKPGVLDEEETVLMNRARRASVEILKHSCTSPEVLAVVEHVSAWYDGRLTEFALKADKIPLGSRMVTLVEAYDSMTTDHVFRPARSQEFALAELFHNAGTQFDPDLVKQFADFQRIDSGPLHGEVAGRWLRLLDPDLVNSYWELNNLPSIPTSERNASLFEAKLLENMYDAVIFFDSAGRISQWNRGAERLTGISSGSIRGHLWQPEMLKLADEKGMPIHDSDCPVTAALQSGVQSLRRLTMVGRMGRPIAVDTHVITVSGNDGVMLGAILLFHDATCETSLEQRCQTLYDKSTKDPLTQVANRAEFDRVLDMFVAAHKQQAVPCSLMMCDLDHFKRVNDDYGHQAGDDAIKSVASVLKNSSRPGDLVARYGGEEFVMLFADCDNATATRRSEQIRKTLSQISQPRLEGRSVTASFGVTEIQPGDTAETMLRRADRGLLEAKGKGRNCVVQLGIGSNAERADKSADNSLASEAKDKFLLEKTLLTSVPLKMAIEKLRGFVADHQAKIASLDGNTLSLVIDESNAGRLRRIADRTVSFAVDLTFEEERKCREDDPSGVKGAVRTKIQVCIQPNKTRNRRHEEISRRAQEVFVSLRSYLMAIEEEQSPTQSTFVRVGRVLAPWLVKKQ
jgi:diguanylate cyclase (GGDEF)-like protein/PAS domain S-box-containing protein